MDFSNIIASAQKLMLDENYWQKLDQAASMHSGTRCVTKGTKINETLNQPIQRVNFDPSLEQRKVNKNLPAFLQESFDKMPPQSGDLSVDSSYAGQIPASFFEGLNGGMSQISQSNVEKPMPEMKINTQRPMVSETIYQQQPSSNNGNIDYNYIKYLIDESIKTHMANNTLNESANGNMCVGMRLAAGNKFQFMDTKGNLYEGVLTLKKKSK